MRSYRKIIITVKYSGCTTNDMKDDNGNYNMPNIIICHVDTKSKIGYIVNYNRYDRKNIDKKITALDEKLQNFCEENKVDDVKNKNMDEASLGQKKLHLGKKGNAYLATKFI